MKALLKRFGAAGTVVLVLNEIRGLVMVALALGAASRGDGGSLEHVISNSLACAVLVSGC